MRGSRTPRAIARRSLPPAPTLVLAGLVAVAAQGGLATPVASAQDAPSADEIVSQMKQALEPDKPTLRRMKMILHEGGKQHGFGLVQARKRVGGEARSVTVLLEPEDAKGLAYLVADRSPGKADNREWVYVPVVRRVRELVPAENHTTFLDSDFTYADLGFLDLRSTNKLLGVETSGGKKQYQVESIPDDKTRQWYYARVVTWVDAETLLPSRREFYAPSGLLFKVQTFENVSRVDGVPTPFKTTMENIPTGTSTDLVVTDVAYGMDIPDEYFGPDKLRTLGDLALWKQKPPASSPTAP